MRVLKNEKGQAMTELVISIPVILLLLGGMLQFFLIMSDNVKLSMLEHELVMFDSSTGTSNMSKMIPFALEYAEYIGLDPDKLTVQNQTVGDKIPGTNIFFDAIKVILAFIPALTDTLYGRDIIIAYDVELMAPFKFISPGGTVTLNKWIHSGVGDNFEMDLNPVDILEKIFDKFLHGAKWIVNLIKNFFRGKV